MTPTPKKKNEEVEVQNDGCEKHHLSWTRQQQYPGSMTRFSSYGAHCLKTSREKPPVIIPGVAKRTQGPGAFIKERSKLMTATFHKFSIDTIRSSYIFIYTG